ncbi:MAG: hypothetical protein AUJ52_15385 [Elusimicrobia bacterium CG1_02_63_36]|nr:MAG: hypothetical protein AUJ52_15385 [Elusimicrobia bacterium CG1_02_63_36]PIP83962.1 MAG: hypothetical protein COR54_06620 [Elusimicrobia bacterium CG22_combo_CG10-13_8_21_14_all_63_91]PJA17259.1 MAG: hypothetical protein COX66_05070 [Elusimicrobia bacterium CG_4_10_14_0_2_um_filter_63_34]PJB23860.1 MAG: hypothetical protein CO113_16595 [Elusimicrobia bacterium CG_4_9_14_3_um_filter_62_55]
MGKRGRRRGGRPPRDAGQRGRFWSVEAAFAVWAAFILAKTYSGSAGILAQGASFFPAQAAMGAAGAVSAGTLVLNAVLDLTMIVVVAVAAFGFGMPVVRRLFAAPAGRLERSLLAEGLGLGLFSLGLLVLGVIGVAPEASVYAVSGAGIGLNAYELVVRLSSPPPKSSPEAPGFFSTLEPLEWTALAAIVYAAALHVIGALTPETFYDSLVYHLAAPAQYIQRGRITPLPTPLHANFPQNMEMLYLAGLVLRGEIAAKTLHFWMGALSCLAIYEFGRTACSRRTALIAAALFATAPVVGVSFWHTGVELAAAFWSLMGAWSLVRGVFALSNPTQRREQAPRWIVVSGVFFGFAMGTKYTALWSAAAAAGALAWILASIRALDRGLIARLVLIWVVSAVSALSPWLMKSFLFTGNPVYPFLGTVFGSGNADIVGFTASARGHFWHGGALAWRTWILMPWELFSLGRSSFSFIGPLLVLFAPLALLRRRAAFPFGILLALFGVQFVMWACSTSMIRMLIPALPLFCLYAGHLLTRLGRDWKPWVPWIALLLVFWNLSWNAAMLNEMRAPGVVFGRETRSNYRSRPQHGYPTPVADVAAWVGDNLPVDAKILLSGDARSYPIPRLVVAASIFDPDPLLARTRDAASPEELYVRLRSEGFTHLIIGHAEAYRNRADALKNLSAAQLKTLVFFLKAYAKPLYRSSYGTAVYRLEAPDGPVRIPISNGDLPELVRIAIAHGARL